MTTAAAPASLLALRLSSLGDIVLLLPALRALRAAHPRAHLALAVRERYAGLFRGQEWLDEVAAVPGGAAGGVPSLRTRRWDLLLDFQATGRSRRLAAGLSAGARFTVRRDRWRRWRLVAAARWSGSGGGTPGRAAGDPAAVHVAERYLELARRAGATAAALREAGRTPFVPSAEAAGRARELLASAGHRGEPLLALLPGASHPVKAWPPSRFAALARLAADRRSARAIFLGGLADRAEVERAAASPACLAAVVTDDLALHAALLSRASGAVAADSGLGHLAAAAGVPLVSLFGPTVRGFGFAPRAPAARILERDLGCRPCSLHGNRPCRLGTHACLRSLEPAEVFDALESLAVFRDPSRGG